MPTVPAWHSLASRAGPQLPLLVPSRSRSLTCLLHLLRPRQLKSSFNRPHRQMLRARSLLPSHRRPKPGPLMHRAVAVQILWRCWHRSRGAHGLISVVRYPPLCDPRSNLPLPLRHSKERWRSAYPFLLPPVKRIPRAPVCLSLLPNQDLVYPPW